jgi:hypothetical protein
MRFVGDELKIFYYLTKQSKKEESNGGKLTMRKKRWTESGNKWVHQNLLFHGV